MRRSITAETALRLPTDVSLYRFMKEDYLPASAREADRALAEIEMHGERQAWTEARALRIWLSQSISAAS